MASIQKVTWRHYFLVLITVMMLVECIDGSKDGQLSFYLRAVFQDGSGTTLNQMVVSNESGTDFVYIGGLSTLYQLDLNLALLRKESTVPDDTAECERPACLYDTKILEVAPSPVGKLIQCGGPEGKCELRNLTDISREFGYTYFSEVVNVNDGMSSVGVVAVRQSGTKEVFMYVAQSKPQPNGNEPPITQRELITTVNPKFIFDYSGEINRVTDAVDYIQGVSWMTYNYFIVHSGSERSRLGRICSDNTQDDLDAYSEIILSCQSYSILQAVYIDSNDVLYGVFTNGTYSALCSYTMNDIQEKFVDTTCGCVIPSSQDASCSGTGISYLSSQSRCLPYPSLETRQTIQDNFQCGIDGQFSFKYAQATSPLTGNPLAASLPGQHSSIVTLNKDNETVALVSTSTTSTATLTKIHVKPNNIGRLYETVNFEVGGNILHDVYINQDSEELYILTTNELMKLAVVNCSQYSSCDECLGPTNDDGDPFCGWCTLERKCSRSNECSNLNWLQYNQDCITINNLDPPSQELDSAPLMVSFSVSPLTSLQSGSQYTCRFNEVVTNTTVNGRNFTCMTPAVDVRPVIPDGENSVTMTLGIFSSATNNIIVVEEFYFFMCSAMHSCSECVESGWGCDWCVYEGRCTLDGLSSCTTPTNEVVVSNATSCPRPDDVSTEILTTVGLSTSRAIYLKGFSASVLLITALLLHLSHTNNVE